MTILDILDASGLDWKDTPMPDEVKACCPFCVERNETPDERYRLGINVRTGKAHCFNCGWSGSDYVFTARDLARVGDVDMTGDRVTAHKENPKRPKPKIVAQWLDDLPSGYEAFNWKSTFEREARNYLVARGITREQIERWKIGWAMTGRYAGRVIIPVVMDQRIAGVVCRDYGNFHPEALRWLNSEGLRGIFGSKGNKHAHMSEGAMDALRIEPVFPATDSICVFGSNLSDEQIQFLKRYESITYMGDHDAAGCKGARYNCALLSEAGIKMRVAIPKKLDGTDPGTQSNEFLLHRSRAALSWSNKTEMLLRYREAFG